MDFPSDTPLASGRWVKVKVDSTGVQRMSHDVLRSWGFAHPEKVGVRGFGSVEMSLEFSSHPATLPEVRVMHRDGALYFYGEGETRFEVESAKSVSVKTNRYSRGSYYFLSDASDVAAMEQIASDATDATLDTHTSIAVC